MSPKSAVIFFLLVSLLTACNLTTSNLNKESPTIPTIPPTPLPFPTALPPTPPPTAVVISPSAIPSSLNQTVLDRAGEVIQTLKSQDMVSLSSYVHPVNGVRFSPYAYVKDTDQVFSADEVVNLSSDNTIYTWGVFDGSGAPIDLSFPDYYSKFIYDVDFANAPKMALNYRLGVGNSIDNSLEFYPGAMTVEYYFPGFDPQYGGMDWRSLRLVFTEYNNTWYLTGIIHDEWTI
jgi:hypothetical protein